MPAVSRPAPRRAARPRATGRPTAGSCRSRPDRRPLPPRAPSSRASRPANFAALALDRTMSEPMPESDVEIASGRLKARKSVSGSGRSDAKRQHDQAGQRVRDRGRVVTVGAAGRAQLVGHLIGRLRTLARLFRQGAPQHAIDRSDRRRAGQRGRLLVDGRVRDLDDRAARERRPSRRASRTEWRPPRTDRSACRAARPAPVRATCNAACPRPFPRASARATSRAR